MSDALKQLLENDAVSEQVRTEIEEAWNQRVEENRRRVTNELREEFAQKYEHDKELMTEAVDNMVSEKLAEELEEFKHERKELDKAKVRYTKAIKEHATLMNRFVVSQLKEEISELHKDKKLAERRYAKLEEFIVESLAKEITEFDTDRKDLVETKVKLVKTAKNELNKLKENFIKRSAKTVSTTVSRALSHELSQLKEDVEQARKNDFGRKLFEAFSQEYSASYMNEKSELGRMAKILKTKEKQLAEAKKVAHDAKILAESQQRKHKKLLTESKRNGVIAELVNPLNPEQQRIMRDLLESVQTDRLQSAFDRYLPTVINGEPEKRKATLTESRSVTGNRDNITHNNDDNNVYDLRRLAGLK